MEERSRAKNVVQTRGKRGWATCLPREAPSRTTSVPPSSARSVFGAAGQEKPVCAGMDVLISLSDRSHNVFWKNRVTGPPLTLSPRAPAPGV